MNADGRGDTKDLSGGILRDANGAPKEYHILKQHPGKIFGATSRQWTKVPAFGTKTGLPNLLHVFQQDRPGQTRGVPDFAPVIETLKQLGVYTQAEIDAAVISSFFTVFIQTATGGTGLAPMQPISETGGSASDTDMKLASGAILGLAQDESISTANPGRPNTSFDPFVQAILQQIGAALQLPFEVLTKHFSASYSAARASLLEAWRYFNSERAWLVSVYLKPIYRLWMHEAVASGRLTAPGFFADPIIEQAYLGSSWTGPPRGMIDEKKESAAAKELIALSLCTHDEKTAELTGGDWEKKFPQLAREEKMKKAAGLGVTQTAAAPGATAVAAPPITDDEDDEEDEE